MLGFFFEGSFPPAHGVATEAYGFRFRICLKDLFRPLRIQGLGFIGNFKV